MAVVFEAVPLGSARRKRQLVASKRAVLSQSAVWAELSKRDAHLSFAVEHNIGRLEITLDHVFFAMGGRQARASVQRSNGFVMEIQLGPPILD
jgi:hypothetical protein